MYSLSSQSSASPGMGSAASNVCVPTASEGMLRLQMLGTAPVTTMVNVDQQMLIGWSELPDSPGPGVRVVTMRTGPTEKPCTDSKLLSENFSVGRPAPHRAES